MPDYTPRRCRCWRVLGCLLYVGQPLDTANWVADLERNNVDSVFDFEAHKAQSIAAYSGVRRNYEMYAGTLKHLLDVCLRDLPIHTIEARAKDVSSFGEKAAARNSTDESMPAYPNPLQDITDLTGARIITYFPKSLIRVEEIITREFDVIERSDKSTAFEKSGRLGYQSIHLLVRLNGSRTTLREYAPFNGLTAEIQIRTILQHAWAEMEHDIQYKALDQIPTEIRRRFAALAGLIEIADREFQAIQDSDAELRTEIIASLVVEPRIDRSDAVKEIGSTDSQHAPSEALVASEGTQGASSAVREGDYSEAIRRYDALIAHQPAQYAHYLGRASARFLSGNRLGALDDLETAERIAPGHDHIRSVRRKIDEGFVAVPAERKAAAAEKVTSGHAKLRNGEGANALQDYCDAEDLGFSSLFCSFNRAMALTLLQRFADSEEELSAITPFDGSNVKINCVALRQINQVLGGFQPQADLTEIESLVAKNQGYEFSFSPLKELQCGLTITLTPNEHSAIEPIFSALKRGVIA
jgi:ppGpp synthetase/RelA/SpoT-type nucleotidyltranferase